MCKKISLFILFFVFSQISISAQSEHKNSIRWDQDTINKILEKDIIRLTEASKNRTLIASIEYQTSKEMTLDIIKSIDLKWQENNEETPIKKLVLSSDAGVYLKGLINASGNYTEAFITDSQGATVAAYPLTSDYWQGDEDKFIKAMQPGNEKVYIGEMEWDQSSQFNAVKISIPMYHNERVIGLMVVGVKLSHIMSKQLEGLMHR